MPYFLSRSKQFSKGSSTRQKFEIVGYGKTLYGLHRGMGNTLHITQGKVWAYV
jgi:hypothetical protein